MGWTVSVVSVVVFMSALLCAGITVFALRNRPDPMAWPLAVLTFMGFLWATPHAISFGVSGLEQVVFWNKLVYPSASLVPVAYLVFALRYAGYERWLSWQLYAVLCVVPFISAVTAWVDPAPGLFYQSVDVQYVGNAATISFSRGPVFLLNMLFSYLLIGLTWLIFIGVILRDGPMHRRQAALMLSGGIVPTLFNFLFNLGIGPFPSIDLTSSSLAISGAAFAVALFRYNLLGLTPAAYRSVPDLFADGVLVFDENEHLIEANDHASDVLGTPLSIGTHVTELFNAPFDELDGTVLTADKNSQRMYTVRYSPLCNKRDERVGHALALREVTALKEHQQRLSVTNRVLRHNLRNEINIILGEADVLEAKVNNQTDRESLQRILSAATRLNDVGQKARHIQTSLTLGADDRRAIDVVDITDDVIEQYRTLYPDAEIRQEGPSTAMVFVAGGDPLKTIVRNIVENALEHNDSDNPTVVVTVAIDAEIVTVRVSDDGPGIPPEEHEILGKPSETPLQHGSSLGLWLTYWLVSATDGTIEFEHNEPRGTVVTLQFPAADETEQDDTVPNAQIN
ncbi:histidine kinase N-terminal 7TM domain-containing protein [Halovenus rubra]|uniref:Histidine kinase N-terminal 7TM domain-containing protein n=2 Tax=Halovenus rubra TaxID=869890 RepID=A0ACC7E1N7_9EURY|nr:histidine kinase N-terminal 7TM domain-containing protein [Halovenus rubra]